MRLATIALALVLLAAPLAAVAQPAARIWRIGYFAPGAQPPDGLPPAALRQGLQALGYVEGKNITFISRWAEGKSDRMPRLAEEIVRSNVDLIVTLGGPHLKPPKRPHPRCRSSWRQRVTPSASAWLRASLAQAGMSPGSLMLPRP